jgi:alkanesulfonate monooxygenase SsuD/methylene tetrahydromethanopterin reductase-like flavin-dependent oxidoreductase (luciferase family)
MTDRGIGLAAAIGEQGVRQAARLVARHGFHAFWLNNPPHGNALALLGATVADLPDMMLGVGVIPLSYDPPQTIIENARSADLPLDRLYLGIGSGSGTGGVERVRNGVREIRDRLDCTIVVAALGPRMCRLAGEMADGVLLNWLTPEFAATSTGWIQEGADAAGRPMPRRMAYVRTALTGEGSTRLTRESASYESYPQYAAHFKRMGTRAEDTAIHGTPDEVRAALDRWEGRVDELVLRVITANDAPDEIERVIAAVAPVA